MTDALRCIDLGHRYPGADADALDGIDLTVPAGGAAVVVGPSGAGKSTLLAVLAGLTRPSRGRVEVDGVDLTRASDDALRALRRRSLAVAVQNPFRNLLPYGSALDNLRLVRRTAGIRGGHDPVRLLDALGLGDIARSPVHTLSGGERQRVALASAASAGPRLLLVDEPTSQLDRVSRDRVVALLQRINQDLGTAVLAVTHDPEVADALGGVVRLRDGRIEAGR